MLLLNEPSSDVTVTLTSDNQITLSTNTLTFTPGDWTSSKTVTVSAVDDTVVEGTQNSVLTFAVSSVDANYNGLSIASLPVTVTDNDVADDDDDDDSLTYEELESLSSEDDCDHPFIDVYGQWHEPIICKLYESSVVDGRSDTRFVPNDNATKGEVTKMIVRLLLGKGSGDATGLKTGFSDLGGKWYEPYVMVAEEEDVVRTRDFGLNFEGDSTVTRGRLAVYIVRALGLTSYEDFDDYTDVPNWRYDAYAIGILSNKEVDVPYDDSNDDLPVLSGYSDDTFRPDNPIARSEAAAMIYRAYLAYLAD